MAEYSTIGEEGDGTWSILVNSKIFSSLIRQFLPDRKVRLDFGKNRLLVSYGDNLYKLETKDADVYPNFLKAWECTPNSGRGLCSISIGELSAAARRVGYISGGTQRESKIEAISVEIQPPLIRFICTEGRRIGISTHPCRVGDRESSFLLGRGSFTETVSVFEKIATREGEINLSFDDHLVLFSGFGLKVGVRPHAVTFPDYSLLVNSKTEVEIKVDRKLLLSSISRLSVLSAIALSGHRIRFFAEGPRLSIETYLSKDNEGREEIEINPTERLEFFANGQLLRQGLEAIEDEAVTISKQEGELIRLQPKNPEEQFIYILAGLRVDG